MIHTAIEEPEKAETEPDFEQVDAADKSDLLPTCTTTWGGASSGLPKYFAKHIVTKLSPKFTKCVDKIDRAADKFVFQKIVALAVGVHPTWKITKEGSDEKLTKSELEQYAIVQHDARGKPLDRIKFTGDGLVDWENWGAYHLVSSTAEGEGSGQLDTLKHICGATRKLEMTVNGWKFENNHLECEAKLVSPGGMTVLCHTLFKDDEQVKIPGPVKHKRGRKPTNDEVKQERSSGGAAGTTAAIDVKRRRIGEKKAS